MSFKRDGNDGSQLNLLKKRRVAELLANDIPDDEAILMSNGRYACTVCHYRPVFDTVDMLTVHRSGKKHQHATENHFRKKRELAMLVQRRQAEAELRSEGLPGRSNETNEPAPLLQKVEEAKKRALLKEAPYNPCHKGRRDGSTTGSNAKPFFHRVQQMQLKSLSQRRANQMQPNLNSSNQSEASSHLKKETHVRPTPLKQSPDTGVSTFEIKPYIPKSKRGSSSSGLSSSSRPGEKTMDHSRVSTSSSLTEEWSLGYCGNSSPVKEVSAPQRQFISEYLGGEILLPNAKQLDVNVISETVLATGNPVETFTKDQKQGAMRVGDVRVTNLNAKTEEISSRRLHQSPNHISEDLKEGTSSVHKTSNVISFKLKVDDVGVTNAKTEEISRRLHPSQNHSPDLREGPSPVHKAGNVISFKLSGGVRNHGKDSRLHTQAEPSIQSAVRSMECSSSDRGRKEKGTKEKKEKKKSQNPPKRTAERQKEIERYLELTSAGWVQDRGGQWVKGQDVEFDSDEEPPT
ncbi:uncharacterized protein [Diadema setosum]|uniref:uncharacterized protein n=1 Tax=Diadema setosum TaxID=31175 RepID=UPI003B3A2471